MKSRSNFYQTTSNSYFKKDNASKKVEQENLKFTDTSTIGPETPSYGSYRPKNNTASQSGINKATIEKKEQTSSRSKKKHLTIGQAIEYILPKKNKRSSASYSSRRLVGREKYVDYLAKFGWAFCLFLFLRLIFADRGVMDYYKRMEVLEERKQVAASILKENDSFMREISKIKSDRAYQKKLVRDGLGFIAKDEFLILFPQGTAK